MNRNGAAIRALAKDHLEAILTALPGDRLARFLLFIEVVRAMDYWSIGAYPASEKDDEVGQSLDLMYWGWNRAVAELFTPLDQAGAFPLLESTKESRASAVRLMQELGKVSLAHRLADMADREIMEIAGDGDEFHIQMSENAQAQFADVMEIDHLTAAADRAKSSGSNWTTASMRDATRFPGMPGNYMALADAPVRRWLRPDIENLIKPLVRPWNTGHGVMVAYDARIEVDKHYMAQALRLSTNWREASGIHSNAKLGSITGADIAGVGAALISLHAKHFGCVSVAKTLFPNVSFGQSLTIWGPKAELEESIAEMIDRPAPVVHAAFNALAMTSEHAKKLAGHSTPLIPLLFDLGNGFVLRPISSLTRNPFTAAKTQHQWLDQTTLNAVATDRESWMRGDLYDLFRGKRYTCFHGNIKLRRGGSVLTDIDAVVYDRATGVVGLFQLKWQDYSTNDVRQLRSKASNLSAELEDWSAKVHQWIKEDGVSILENAIRKHKKRREKIDGVLLFAISRASIRSQGYGVTTNAPGLAMAVWPQFVRARIEIGPSHCSLRDIHARLLEEFDQTPKLRPMAASIRLAGKTIHIRDFWNRIQE